MAYVLGVDVGTTGTKARLIDEGGVVISHSYKGYELLMPGKKMVEQRAEDWWEAFVETVRECTESITDKNNILAISVSSQGASMVPVDRNCKPMMNAIVWMDKRGDKQKEELLKINPDEYYYKKTGWKLESGSNLIQICWLRDNERDIYEKAYKFLSTLEYINFKLTGRYVIDVTNGGMTQLMDISTGDWDVTLMQAAGISRDRLADVEQPGAVLGTLTETAAQQLGLSKNTKVINGGHDQYCASVGTGAIHEGDVLLSAGTAWVIMGNFSQPVFDADSYIAPGRHIVKGLWGALMSIPTGGISIEWFRDNFIPFSGNESEDGMDIMSRPGGKLYEEGSTIMDLMKKVEGLFFYPHFNGSGYPHWCPDVKASLVGLGLEHDSHDVAFAIMEGLAFEAAWALEEFKKKGCKAGRLRVLGGASRNELLSGIIANVTGIPVIRSEEADSACIGAAIIAGIGCGLFGSFDNACKKATGKKTYTGVDSISTEYYKVKLEKYKKTMGRMEELYKCIGTAGCTHRQIVPG